MTDIVDQELIQAEKIYLDFFDTTPKYVDRIKQMHTKNERRLIIDLNDLRISHKDRVEKLMKNSFIEISACQRALKRCIVNVNEEFSKKFDEFFVGFEGSFGSRQLNPRTLTSEFLGNMVCVQGIVTKASVVKSKVVHSVHYCPATNKSLERRYTDMTSTDPYPSSGAYPTKDEEGNILETEFGLSTYKDSQTITIQEMPENAPAGQLPRSVEVILDNDLVDSCKAGDRVYVTGQFRCLPGKKGGFTTATFRLILIANHVCPIAHKSSVSVEDSDIVQMRRLAKRSDIINLLTRSIAPSICGHEFIKQAVLCQLLGGVERILLNGSRIRGDINILLLGDPSVAKSQILRFVLQCARDRAIATTGRGSSGVGLTAAVVTDRETGERGLEAGAMVLADRGIVCIDEFDKMSDIDRTAIHEVMEQGRVTIAKAGIHAKLNARCSVLAAANPVYGRYDQYKTPMENIGLQDSLLSRFDLLFIILDQCDPDADRSIAEFVCKMHKYRVPGEDDGAAMPLQSIVRVDYVGGNAPEEPQKTSGEIFEKKAGVPKQEQYLSKQFLEKYIYEARKRNPKLTKEASTILHEKYCDLRSQEIDMANNRAAGSNKYRTQPITARTMETLIRLATAHAKARLSDKVLVRDAEAAADLVSFVMFKEVLRKSHKRSKLPDDSDEEGEVNSLIDDFQLTAINRPAKKIRMDNVVDNTEEEGDDENKENESGAHVTPVTLSEPEMEELTKLLSNAFRESNESSLQMAQLMDWLRRRRSAFNDAQVRACVQKLHDDNRVMLTADDTVYML